MKQNALLKALVALAICIVLNVLAGFAYARFDLTEDQRYTLSKPALEISQTFEGPVIIDIL